MIKIKTINIIEVDDWDKLVVKTYGRPYKFQQQEGCQSRGLVIIKVPTKLQSTFEDDNDLKETIPEKLETDKMGVKFKSWLARDPKKKIGDREEDYVLELWWYRNFYPNIDVVANDL